ncbi:MAG TPA: efflux RND transporter periplasmic adaptor subunit [Candidatus Acidoferrum sp.]|jgi:RND family efflux transporter MFP subunit|nr:efflux RND transporter periplasmic adaptor subunit [Candidatus Acidoferrum sp.]
MCWAIGCGLAGLAVQTTGCGNDKPTSSVSNAASLPEKTAATARPTPSGDPADSSLMVSGPIIVEHQVDLTAQRDGVVAKIFSDVPARVKAGALLAQLDDRQITANLEAARAKSRGIQAELKNWQSEAQVLKADYARAQNLWDLGLTSEEQLQHAKYKAESDQWDIKRVEESLNSARQEEKSLELELEKTKITAPFTALVARRYVREGQTVAKGDRLFWVTSEAPLLLRFTLPEKFFGQLQRGQNIEVTSPNAVGEKHGARVREVSPVVDPASGTFEVLLELSGDRGSLRPGMTASARLRQLP